MNIEKISEKDIEEINKLSPDNWAHIGPIIELYLKFDFCHSIKITENDEIIGIGTAILYKDTSWIAHLIVKHNHRNKGIGTKILNYLCDYIKNNGYKTILLFATDMGYPLYKKYGFELQTEYIQYEKIVDAEYDVCSNIKNIEKDDYEIIYKMDRIITGEDRKVLLKNYINDGFVYKKDNQIIGYYLCNLGNGLIIAENEEAGLALLKLRISNNQQAFIPIKNITGNNYFKENNFKEIKKLIRMIYGDKIECIDEKIYNRIGGNFG